VRYQDAQVGVGSSARESL